MSDPSLLRLEVDGADGTAMTGLFVQTDFGRPPDYPTDYYRLYLADSSSARLLLDGQAEELVQGQLLTLSPGERVEFDDKANLSSCAFHHNFFCVRVMRNEVFCDGIVFNRLRGFPVVNLPEQELDIVRHRFRELLHIVGDESLFKSEHAINLLRSLLLQAADCKIRFSESSKPLRFGASKGSELISRFKDLVEKHYTEHLEIARYCDLLGVSVVTLNRHVKSELGQTAKQVAQERLAIEARVALRSGERSIKEVAFDLGFEDPLYFSRFFRKQFGAAPTHYFSGTPD